MKISNKLHRGCAVGAAVLLILGIMVNISTFFSLQPGYRAEERLVLLGNTGVQVLTNAFLIFVLFQIVKFILELVFILPYWTIC